MGYAKTVFGARPIFEIYSMGGNYGASAFRRRIVHAHVGSAEEAEAYINRPEHRQRSMKALRRWAFRVVGEWYLLASVAPIHILNEARSNRYAEIDAAIQNECAPALAHIVEGQAEVIRQQGELLDRCLQVLQDPANLLERRKLINAIRHNLTEIPDGHEDAVR